MSGVAAKPATPVERSAQPPTPALRLDYRAAAPPRPPERDPSGVAALVCGLLLIAPFVPGLLAVAFGASVVLKGSDARVLDRAFGIAGLALGSLNVVFWLSVTLSLSVFG